MPEPGSAKVNVVDPDGEIERILNHYNMTPENKASIWKSMEQMVDAGVSEALAKELCRRIPEESEDRNKRE
jgi:hypothetical protein